MSPIVQQCEIISASHGSDPSATLTTHSGIVYSLFKNIQHQVHGNMRQFTNNWFSWKYCHSWKSASCTTYMLVNMFNSNITDVFCSIVGAFVFIGFQIYLKPTKQIHIDIHENIHLSIYKEKIYLYIYYTTLVRSWSTPFSFGVPFRQDKAFPESPGEDIEEKEPAAWDALEQQEEGQDGEEERQDGEEEKKQDGEEEKKQDGEEEKKQHDELQEVEDSPEWQEWDPEPDETRLRNRKEWPLVFRPKPPPKKFQPKKMPRPSDGGGKKDEKKKDEKKKDEKKKDEKKKDEKKKDERNKADGKKGGVGGWKFPPPPPKPIGRKGEVAAVVKGPQQPTFPPPPPKPDKTMAEIPPRPPPVPVKKKPALPAPPRPPPAPVPKEERKGKGRRKDRRKGRRK